MPPLQVRLNLPGFSSPEPFRLAHAPPSIGGLACAVLEEIGGFSKEELDSIRNSPETVPLILLGELCAGQLVVLESDAQLEVFLATAESPRSPATIEVRHRDEVLPEHGVSRGNSLLASPSGGGQSTARPLAPSVPAAEKVLKPLASQQPPLPQPLRPQVSQVVTQNGRVNEKERPSEESQGQQAASMSAAAAVAVGTAGASGTGSQSLSSSSGLRVPRTRTPEASRKACGGGGRSAGGTARLFGLVAEGGGGGNAATTNAVPTPNAPSRSHPVSRTPSVSSLDRRAGSDASGQPSTARSRRESREQAAPPAAAVTFGGSLGAELDLISRSEASSSPSRRPRTADNSQSVGCGWRNSLDTPVFIRLYQEKDDRRRRLEEARVRHLEQQEEKIRISAQKALGRAPSPAVHSSSGSLIGLSTHSSPRPNGTSIACSAEGPSSATAMSPAASRGSGSRAQTPPPHPRPPLIERHGAPASQHGAHQMDGAKRSASTSRLSAPSASHGAATPKDAPPSRCPEAEVSNDGPASPESHHPASPGDRSHLNTFENFSQPSSGRLRRSPSPESPGLANLSVADVGNSVAADISSVIEDARSLRQLVKSQQQRIEFLEQIHQQALRQLGKCREDLAAAHQQRFREADKILRFEQLISEMQVHRFDGAEQLQRRWDEWIQRSRSIADAT